MQQLTKGYTLIELCIVISIISLFMAFHLNQMNEIDTEYYEFYDQYHFKQSQAIASSNRIESDIYNYAFNEHGNVNHADTYHFKNGDIVVELGSGTLVVKE